MTTYRKVSGGWIGLQEVGDDLQEAEVKLQNSEGYSRMGGQLEDEGLQEGWNLQVEVCRRVEGGLVAGAGGWEAVL